MVASLLLFDGLSFKAKLNILAKISMSRSSELSSEESISEHLLYQCSLSFDPRVGSP